MPLWVTFVGSSLPLFSPPRMLVVSSTARSVLRTYLGIYPPTYQRSYHTYVASYLPSYHTYLRIPPERRDGPVYVGTYVGTYYSHSRACYYVRCCYYARFARSSSEPACCCVRARCVRASVGACCALRGWLAATLACQRDRGHHLGATAVYTCGPRHSRYLTNND